MKCSKVIERLERLAPTACACEWDNVGLLAGRWEKEVKKVLIALDATDQVVDEAAALEADLLLTHHPLIFKPLKKIHDKDFIGRRILRMIQMDMNYYAMHTNFDAANGCMADLAAGRLGLVGCQVLEPSGFQEAGAGWGHPMVGGGTLPGALEGASQAYGIGRVGQLPKAMALEALANQVKASFGLPYLTVYGAREVQGLIQKVAICPGSGGSVIPQALAAGAQVLVTGDISHHQGIDAAARQMAVIDAGHYGLEHIFVDFMAQYLGQEMGDELAVFKTGSGYPTIII